MVKFFSFSTLRSCMDTIIYLLWKWYILISLATLTLLLFGHKAFIVQCTRVDWQNNSRLLINLSASTSSSQLSLIEVLYQCWFFQYPDRSTANLVLFISLPSSKFKIFFLISDRNKTREKILEELFKDEGSILRNYVFSIYWNLGKIVMWNKVSSL